MQRSLSWSRTTVLPPTFWEARTESSGTTSEEAEEALASRSGGDKIRILLAGSERDEAAYVAEEVLKLRGLGFRFGDMAVLYRINA
jgi:DNA helicase-2/ATP-dependent DNA helicase PcrA